MSVSVKKRIYETNHRLDDFPEKYMPIIGVNKNAMRNMIHEILSTIIVPSNLIHIKESTIEEMINIIDSNVKFPTREPCIFYVVYKTVEPGAIEICKYWSGLLKDKVVDILAQGFFDEII